jgi:hypothetical protein
LNLYRQQRIIEDMKLRSTIDQIKPGSRIVYIDGRPGHKAVPATVLAVDDKGMTVEFEDRADTGLASTKLDCQKAIFGKTNLVR